MTDDEKASIDAMSLEDLLRAWRFAPAGTFQHGDPKAEYFQERMRTLREANPAEWTAASKEIGW